MINTKKYRPIILWILLSCLIIVFYIFGIFVLSGIQQVFLLVASVCFTLVLLLCFTYYFEIKNDRIIIRHGLYSSSKEYFWKSNFITTTILIKDIVNVDIINNRLIAFYLKNGISIFFPINGYFKHKEIVNLFLELNKQIKESNYWIDNAINQTQN